MPTLVCCAHGTRDPAAREVVTGLVAAVRAALPDVPVVPAYVDVQSPSPSQALAALGEDDAILVPLLLSSGYHVRVDLRRAADTSPGETQVTAALGPDERLAQLLAERLQDAGYAPGDAVVLAATGSGDPRAARDVEAVADMLSRALDAPVEAAYLAADPRVPDVVRRLRADEPDRRVAIASFLLAPGLFHARLRDCGADVVAEPLLPLGATPPRDLVDIVLDRYASVASC